MKTYVHVSVSLAVAGIAYATGVEWKVAVASALIGGESLDVVDYPIFFLTRERKRLQATVTCARAQGLRAARRALIEPWERREFIGLYLHNVVALALYGICAVVVLITCPSPALFIFFAALFLHVLLDLIGDLQAVGNISNWFWPFHRSASP